MALFIFIIFHLLLEVKSQGLPQAKLTIFPTFVTDEERVQMVCGGHEDLHISECMFYPTRQENLLLPRSSCNLSLTGAELITWSQDQESSHVNMSCYYTVYASGETKTSPHSDRVSVWIRGLATMSSFPPITESSLTTVTPNDTFQVFPLMTEGPVIKKYSHAKMFFVIAVVVSGGGIVLSVLVSIGLYRCTRKSKAERIWIEFSNKSQELALPTASSDATGIEDAALYSNLNFTQPPSQPPEKNKEPRQIEVELNHLYCTILTKKATSSNDRSVYSQLKVH